MTALVFSVAGTPRPQPRPRFVRGRVVSTLDAKAKLWRLAVDRAVRRAIERRGDAVPLYTGPVRLRCEFTFECGAGDAMDGIAHRQKPDADNLAKLCMDVMETAGVFKNDSQVQLHAEKWWGPKPGLVVIVEPISNERREPIAGASTAPPDWLSAGLGLRRGD